MSPGDRHQNVSQIRFDIQLKTKAPLGDPHPRSFILSEVVINVFPGLPSLSGSGGVWGVGGHGLLIMDCHKAIKSAEPCLEHIVARCVCACDTPHQPMPVLFGSCSWTDGPRSITLFLS